MSNMLLKMLELVATSCKQDTKCLSESLTMGRPDSQIVSGTRCDVPVTTSALRLSAPHSSLNSDMSLTWLLSTIFTGILLQTSPFALRRQKLANCVKHVNYDCSPGLRLNAQEVDNLDFNVGYPFRKQRQTTESTIAYKVNLEMPLIATFCILSTPNVYVDNSITDISLSLPVCYEVQILQNGEKSDTSFNNCDKKENHQHYFKASDTSKLLESLSHVSATEKSMFVEFIRHMSYLTAMIEVNVHRGVRCGTCFVQKIKNVTNEPCPCSQCKGLGKKQWGKVTLTTALHVLKDESDGANCQVRLFFDSDESTDQEKIIHGLKSHSRDKTGDWCALVCVTHDDVLHRNLEYKLTQYWNLGRKLNVKYQNVNDNVVVVVSHPHGGPKCVSLGKAKVKDFAREGPEGQGWCHYSYDAGTCDGSSGAPVYVFGRWNDEFGYCSGHSHNHRGVNIYGLKTSTIGVDSTWGLLMTPYASVDLNNDKNTFDDAESTPESTPTGNVIDNKKCCMVLMHPLALNSTVVHTRATTSIA